MNIDGFALPIKQLKGTEPVELLDLQSQRLTTLDAIVIAKCIELNGSLKTVRSASVFALPSSHIDCPCVVHTAVSLLQPAR